MATTKQTIFIVLCDHCRGRTVRSYCKECRRTYNREVKRRHQARPSSYRQRLNSRYKYQHGITIDDYEDLLHKQEYRCANCDRHRQEFQRKLAVDRFRETGEIRGLVCGACILSNNTKPIPCL